MCAEAAGAILAAGKDGVLYTGNAATLGDTQVPNLDPGAVAANYAKLRAPPILYTYFDPATQPAPQSPTALNKLPGGATRHLHGTPLLWRSAVHGLMHFVGGENSQLRAWTLSADGSSSYQAGSNEIASVQSPRPPGGMPGWSITLAANQGADGNRSRDDSLHGQQYDAEPRSLPCLRRSELRRESRWLQAVTSALGQSRLGPRACLHTPEVQPANRLERANLPSHLRWPDRCRRVLRRGIVGGHCVVKLTARLRTAPIFPARTFALAAPNANPATDEDFACEGDRSFWAILRLRAYVRLWRTQPLRHAAPNARFSARSDSAHRLDGTILISCPPCPPWDFGG